MMQTEGAQRVLTWLSEKQYHGVKKIMACNSKPLIIKTNLRYFKTKDTEQEEQIS